MTTVTVVIKLVEKDGDLLFNLTNKQELEDAIRDYFNGNIEVDSINTVFED